MKTYVINLKRSVKRRERMIKALREAKVDFGFIEAVDSSTSNFLYSERRNEALSRKRFGYKLLENEIACFASHHLAWEKCIELNAPILVLEDNCDLLPDFYNHLYSFDDLAQKYDFLKLAATSKNSFVHIESISNTTSIVRFKKKTCGIMGYIITPKAASQFTDNAEEFIEPVDNYMEKPYKHGISTYTIQPDLVKRADIPSTIGNNRKDKTGITLWNKLYIESFRLYEQYKDSKIKHPY